MENLKSCISIWDQLGVYKYLRNIIMNKIIRYFQKIYKLISDTFMPSLHIILIIQCQDQKPQNGTACWTVAVNLLEGRHQI